MGSVSVLVKPEALLAGVCEPLLKGFPVDVWIMEKDGRILYHADGKEIGRNLFYDPLFKPFKDLVRLAQRIANEPSGTGFYEFFHRGTDRAVKKHASWTTVGLYGTDWRIVLIHRVAEDQSSEAGVPTPFHASELVKALSADTELQSALTSGDEAKALSIFKGFFEKNQGIYSIQWLDASGINRFGYPPENSLKNYSIQEGRTFGDNLFKAALSERKETSFDLPLVEGNTGSFFLHPIYSGDQFYGMIYIICIPPRQAPSEAGRWSSPYGS